MSILQLDAIPCIYLTNKSGIHVPHKSPVPYLIAATFPGFKRFLFLIGSQVVVLLMGQCASIVVLNEGPACAVLMMAPVLVN